MGHFGGVLGCKTKEAFAVTRLIVGVSNRLQMARNLTGGLPVLYQGRLANLGPFREGLTPAHETRSERGDGARARGLDSEWTTERTGRTRTDASFEKHADDDMAKCNTQANDMAKTANNWMTPGASNPGRYNTPPLTRDLIPRS